MEGFIIQALAKTLTKYSNLNIFSIMETTPSVPVSNPNDISSNLEQFNETLYKLMNTLLMNASSASPSKFAAGDMNFTSSDKVYGLVQCTPDISESDCRICLRGAVGSSRTKSRTIIIIVVPIVIFLAAVIVFYVIFHKRKAMSNQDDGSASKSLASLQFSLSTVKTATDNFHDANRLGQGGFGSVYKGKLENGQEIAVKRLSEQSSQGEVEFQNEILLLAKLQHRNLVSLLGFCLEGTERILVYEFVSNGSLDQYIFDSIKRGQLSWEMYYKIICGIARGILYLHEDSRLRIIHRDLKASNVLLDEEMNPKISDFGMARLFAMHQVLGNTSRTVGTYGYMAPEYALHGQFSVKSDVFSFGVLLLEIVSGKKNSWMDDSGELEHLLSYAWKHWTEGTAEFLIDSRLRSSSNSETMRYIHIGLLCVQEQAVNRPTMDSVLLMLNSSNLMTLPVPTKPAFLMYNGSMESGQSGNYFSISN
ncbi:hypothetical protein COLO4_15910 [Corchorus olitorius]|uniref:Protein kinase domain-containing protein n=1 Tax=Corchorus olitorius TaxID=93759 RepID=A0A1R3JKM4_9ROSI|nr:hypothetical protein COLO4_15910 [Corchorus olitorius]